MVGHRLRARPGRLTTVGSAEGGVCKERQRRRGQRPRQGRERDGGAVNRACRASESAVDATKVSIESSVQNEVEEGSVDDVGAEYIEYAYVESIEDEISLYQRLYKKRSNMALALYHKNHPDEQYQFLRVRLSDVFHFMEHRLPHPNHMHMNFMALEVKTGLEKLFFAELCMINDTYDGNSGYVASTCEIVDVNSAGGRKNTYFFQDGKFPPDYYDGENCYGCAEKIKHPPGSAYRAGHDIFGYGV